MTVVLAGKVLFWHLWKMSTFSELTPAGFKRIAKLIAKKESLLQKVAMIDLALDAFELGEKASGAEPKKVTSRKRSKRIKLKEQIIAALKEVGAKGHTARELAEKLNVKINNVRVWFYTTGKKVSGLKKSKDGRYSL